MKIRVMVVDDATFIREVVRQLLDSVADIDLVAEAADGLEAVRKAKTTRPDVILMDLALPRLSGIEATREIRRKNPNVICLACSTIDNDVTTLRVLDAGFADYLSKPFTRRQLIEKIRSVTVSQTSSAPRRLG